MPRSSGISPDQPAPPGGRPPRLADVPVIVVHQGLKPYLIPCLRRAGGSNPGGRVLLLGDEANAGIGIGEHQRLDDPALQAGVAEFREAYRHLSTSSSVAFERFCVERWLIVRNLMRRDGLDRCLVIDSDVLLFCDVGEEAARFARFAMTFGRWDARRLVPHCNFIGGREGIESFCEHVIRVYRTPAVLAEVKAANLKKFSRHWVSDMSLFHHWAIRGEHPIGLLEDALREGVGYDNCIDDVRGFVPRSLAPGMLRPWKRIDYSGGIPHARPIGGAAVPMKCLHFHGDFKFLMDRHARGEPDDWSVAATMLRRKVRKLPDKLRLFSRNYLSFAGRRRRPSAG